MAKAPPKMGVAEHPSRREHRVKESADHEDDKHGGDESGKEARNPSDLKARKEPRKGFHHMDEPGGRERDEGKDHEHGAHTEGEGKGLKKGALHLDFEHGLHRVLDGEEELQREEAVDEKGEDTDLSVPDNRAQLGGNLVGNAREEP